MLDTADGERVIVWHVAPRAADKPVVLYFHGNGGVAARRVERFRALTADGSGLVALSYRGYGGSSGAPDRAGLMHDAMRPSMPLLPPAIRSSASCCGANRSASGVAVRLAAEKPVGRLVLEAPFTSAADVGAGVYWFIPVRLLMKDQFRSDLAHRQSDRAGTGAARRSRHCRAARARRAAL